MAHLKNRTAIVTGASRGLGKTIAKLLAQNGANVIINYATNLNRQMKWLAKLPDQVDRLTQYKLT